ncbi:hypothetical protein HU200_042533 [Digitaria exilis]|uniref:Uncharacterized protein n=1 Tax=Digitaria exilis TaxID=1010633 RepID=A0A835B2A6_9POAL|nr:hypothetical protein HU200_042533 [Digitaria exilis]
MRLPPFGASEHAPPSVQPPLRFVPRVHPIHRRVAADTAHPWLATRLARLRRVRTLGSTSFPLVLARPDVCRQTEHPPIQLLADPLKSSSSGIASPLICVGVARVVDSSEHRDDDRPLWREISPSKAATASVLRRHRRHRAMELCAAGSQSCARAGAELIASQAKDEPFLPPPFDGWDGHAAQIGLGAARMAICRPPARNFFPSKRRAPRKMAAAAPVLVHVESIQTAVPSARRRLGPFAAHRRRSCSTVPAPRFTTAAARAARERAVWVKESLSAALVDHPEMALSTLPPRRRRAPPALAKATMAAFLEARRRRSPRWRCEPDICATFFMQAYGVTALGLTNQSDRSRILAGNLTRHNNVSSPSQLTRFPDGGYGIGASCILLLADPLSLIGFLKGWQARGAAGAEQARAAAKRVKSAPLDTATDNTMTTKTATVLFRTAAADDTPDTTRSPRPASPMPARGWTPMRPCDSRRSWRVVVIRNRAVGTNGMMRLGSRTGDLAVEGSKPVRVSYYVSPCADEALVVVVPAAEGQREDSDDEHEEEVDDCTERRAAAAGSRIHDGVVPNGSVVMVCHPTTAAIRDASAADARRCRTSDPDVFLAVAEGSAMAIKGPLEKEERFINMSDL